MRYKIFIVLTDGKSISFGSYSLADSLHLISFMYSSSIKSISITDTAQDD